MRSLHRTRHRTRSRLRRAAPLVAALLVLGPVGTALAAAPSTVAAGPTGAVEVRAAPDSSVFIDGRLRGRTDASGRLLIPGVPAGARRVLVTHPDRLPADREITVRSGEPAFADLTRTDFAPAARIDYDSRPLAVGWDRLDRLPNFLPLLLGLLAVSGLAFWLSYRFDRWLRGG